MRGKVVEVTASGNVRLYTPGKIFTVIVQVAWWLCETYLYIDNVTDRTVFYKLFYFLEVREITSVVSNETRNACFLRNTVDTGTLFVCLCHWLFNVCRLTCFHCHNSISSMRRRRSGNIYSIYFRIVYQFLCVVIPFLDTSFFGIGFCLCTVATHYSYDFRMFYFLESRTTFRFGDFAATDESPFNYLFTHNCNTYCVCFNKAQR